MFLAATISACGIPSLALWVNPVMMTPMAYRARAVVCCAGVTNVTTCVLSSGMVDVV